MQATNTKETDRPGIEATTFETLPARAPGALHCRFCGSLLKHTFADLGATPLCESFLRPEDLNGMEPFYPLHARVCLECFLVQVPEIVSPQDIFTEYAYFSSYSDSWLQHARRYVEQAVSRFGLGGASQVIELASNDGYLLQYFAGHGVPVLGVEPAANVARVAEQKGIPTLVKFFGRDTARELVASGKAADLLIGNNVLAHVPDLNDFVAGMKIVLKPGGAITMEFPHLMRLVEGCQFDTIYHEHFSYLSLLTVEKVFAAHALAVFDVEELPTHGGSLRIYARHASEEERVEPSVEDLRARERAAGLASPDYYFSFGEKVKETKRKLLECLIGIKRAGKSVAAYGAPGKGNTLLNYCGIRTDFLDYAVDRSPYKHGKFLPGTRIPIFPPEKIRETRPDYLLILPWNLKQEIMSQTDYIRCWGGQFIVPIPEVAIYA